MTAKWVVTTATERVVLDEQRHGEATFMVTNQSAKNARAVFDVRTGDGVDESWFTVDDPQRPIRPAASVPYLVKIQVGPQVKPGSYEFEARVCPPDAAPEENFVLSRRVLIEVPPPPAPPKKKFPWWILIVVALVLVVAGVVTWIAWPDGDAEPAVTASASPSASPSAAPVVYVAVPKITGTSVAAATAVLEKAGLKVGLVQRRTAAGSTGLVSRQSVPAGVEVAAGTSVDLEATFAISRPVITAPAASTRVSPGLMPTVTFTQAEPWVTRWVVTVLAEKCVRTIVGDTCQNVPTGPAQLVTAKQATPPVPNLSYEVVPTGQHNGWVLITVAPLDELGNVGDGATVRVFLEH